MKSCKVCGNPLRDDAKFCNYCGTARGDEGNKDILVKQENKPKGGKVVMIVALVLVVLIVLIAVPVVGYTVYTEMVSSIIENEEVYEDEDSYNNKSSHVKERDGKETDEEELYETQEDIADSDTKEERNIKPRKTLGENNETTAYNYPTDGETYPLDSEGNHGAVQQEQGVNSGYDAANNDFILPTSSMEIIDASVIMQLNRTELRLARNEIYARHGRMFDSEDLRVYFNQKSWYYPTIEPRNFNDKTMLTQIERTNIDTIVAVENMYGY